MTAVAPRPRHDQPRFRAAAALMLVLFFTGAGVALAGFSDTTTASDNSFSAAPDWLAPDGTVAVDGEGAPTAGYVAAGSDATVYAQLDDDGNPASGVATVEADLSAVASGAGAVPLSSTGGPWDVHGTGYEWSSGPVTVAPATADGEVDVPVTVTDGAGNERILDGTLVVDTTAPSVTAVRVQPEDNGAPDALIEDEDYRVYAAATDGGPAGLPHAVTVDVDALTDGGTAVQLTAGSWVVGGTTYTYRSAVLTTDATVADGDATVTVTARDRAGNTGTGQTTVDVDGSPPVVAAATIQRATGEPAGTISHADQYWVYASASDAGSGLGTVTADVSAITTGQTALSLSTPGGPWVVGGTTYSHRSAVTTASAPLTEGTTAYSITAADLAGHTAATGFSVTVDNHVRQTGTIGTTSCGTTSSVITVPAGGVPVGQTVIVQLSQREAAVGTISFADSRSNTYTTDATITGVKTRTVVASASVTTALQAGDTITVTHPSGKNSIAYASSWAGIASTNRVAGSATASGTTVSPSATLSATWSGTLVFGAATSKENNTWTEASGYTTLDHVAALCTTNRADHHAAYRTTRSTGSITYNPSLLTARDWTVAVVAYKEADRTPPDVPVLSGTTGDDETTLEWTAETDVSTPVSYRLYRDGTQIYDGTALTYNDTAVSNGSTYAYTVKSYDALSNLSAASAPISLSPLADSSIRFRRTLGSVTCGTSSSVITVPAGGVPAGRTLVIRVAIKEGAATAFTASDTRGNTYTVDHTFSSALMRLATMSAYVATPLQAGDTVTVIHPNSKAEAVSVLEFSGISATNRVGTVAGTTGTSTLPSANVTTSSQRTVLVGAVANADPVTVTEATSWNTQVHQQMNCGGAGSTMDTHGAYRRVDTTGTYTYNPTLSASKEWVNVLVAYKAADDTAPSTPTLTAEAGDAENFLSWTTVTDPSAPVTYHLLRDGAEVYSGTGTSFHDTGRTNGTSYAYALHAEDGAGNDSVPATATLTPLPSWSIHFVQGLGTVTCGNTTHVLTVPAGGVAAHHTVILQVSLRAPGAGSISATDSKGNTYSLDADVTGSLTRTAVLSGYLATALAAGDQITVTTPASGSEALGGAVFSGIAQSSRVDVTGTASGTSVSPLASATTTQARTLVVAAVATKDTPTYTQPSGYTALDGVNAGCGANQTHRGGWKLTTAAGAQSYGPTLSASKEWTDAVVAYRSAGTDASAPSAPTLSGSVGHQKAMLSWTAVTDRTTPVSYRLYRDGAQIYSGAELAFTDTGRTNGVSYSYTVRAVDAAGNQSGLSAAVPLTPTADSTAPAVPTGLAALALDTGYSLTWNAVTDPTDPVTYQLFRDGSQVYSGLTASYTDTAATPGATYTYTVKASDAVPNQSAASSGVTSGPSVVTGPAIARSGAGVTGNITQGGDFYIYANATAGSATITANVNNVSAGDTAVDLVPGSYSVGATTFTHRSAVMVADNPLSAGSKSFSVKPSGGISVNGSVTVDNTPPTATNVQTTNVGGGTVGRPDVGDKITLTFSEEMAAVSILSGWDGTSTNVVVHILQNAGNDTITFWNSGYTQQLPLGTVTGADPVSTTATFGLTGTPSTMVRTGSVIEITLGTIDNAGSAKTTTGAKTLTWTPNASATDRAGLPVSTAPATESGAADADF